MKRVGAKSITSIILFAIVVLVAWSRGVFQRGVLETRDLVIIFSSGLFGFVAGKICYFFTRMNRPSQFYFRFCRLANKKYFEHAFLELKAWAFIVSKDKDWVSVELPNKLHQSLYIILFTLVGLMAINNRGLHLLTKFSQEFSIKTSRYCPKEENKSDNGEAKMGCELMLRAYKLGYTDDLGPCGEQEKEKKKEICTLRWHDEPYPHYFWRKITAFYNKTKDDLGENYWPRVKKRFERQKEDLDHLYGRTKASIASTPRGSHHIFTNLPYPGGRISSFFKKTILPNDCLERYQSMQSSFVMDPQKKNYNSSLFSHAIGHLLFNPHYDQTVGLCRNYTIHWGVAPNFCDALLKRPQSLLKQMGLWGDLQVVYNRYQDRLAIRQLKRDLRAINNPASLKKNKLRQTLPLGQYMSFHCYIENLAENETTTQFKTDKIKLFFHDIRVRTANITLSKDDPKNLIAIYLHLAKLMNPDSGYRKWSKNADEQLLQTTLASSNYILGNLESLQQADIFIGHQWLLQNKGLLEVFPYYLHLKNFVETFRKEYITVRKGL